MKCVPKHLSSNMCLCLYFTNGSGRQHQSGMVKDHSCSHLVLHLLIALIMENATRFIWIHFNIWDDTLILICLLDSPWLQDSPVVPLGKSPRTDVLLRAEQVVLESGGTVLRLAGLYISFWAQWANSQRLFSLVVSSRFEHYVSPELFNTQRLEVRIITGWIRRQLRLVLIIS